MPLLKKKPFTLSEPTSDLEPHERVYQVRITKEIFRDYHDYLNRINLYRQSVWTCRVTGKTNLTYEEAIVSEKDASEKVQQLPEELIAPALHIIQFSTLSLKDLGDTIAERMKDCVFVGAELYGKADNDIYPCKILKIVEGPEKTRYEVEWLDKTKKATWNTLLSKEDLVHKRSPFSRSLLRSFIRESTYRGTPWVLHDKLATKYGISTDPPEHLKDNIAFKDGLVVSVKKRKKNKDRVNIMVKDEDGIYKKKKVEANGSILYMNNEQGNDHFKEGVIKYPIEDLLVQPDPADPVFFDRPSPSRDFKVPMDCVGDLLMVWDFCSFFSKLLHLWPFSLEDFENAVCHKDGNVVLIVESHAALLQLLLKDNGDYFLAVQKKRKKPTMKITLVTWTEFLCDFLELSNDPEAHASISTIKRGHYGILDVRAKLGIYRELVVRALETGIFREKLDELIEQRNALGATRRGEALEEARKKREEKESLRGESHEVRLANGHSKCVKSKLHAPAHSNHCKENGDALKKGNGEVTPQKNALKNSDSAAFFDNSRKSSKKQNMDSRDSLNNCKEVPKDSESHKEVNGTSGKEQRKQYYERELEKRLIKTNPLGKDRHYNRYWWFRRDGRVFVESSDSKEWGYYSTKEELDALMGSLNLKGERERALKKQLEKFYDRISSGLQKRSRDLAHRIEEEAVVRRSTRVRAPPRDNPANAFLRYINKWKEG